MYPSCSAQAPGGYTEKEKVQWKMFMAGSWFMVSQGSKPGMNPETDKTPALQAPAEGLSDSDTYEGVQSHSSLFFSISSSPLDHVDIAV